MRSIVRHPATAAALFAAASLIFVACSDSTTTSPTALRAPAAAARDSGAALGIPGGSTQIAIASNGGTQYCGIAAGEFAPVFGTTTFVPGTCAAANDVNALLISTYNPGWDTPFTGSDWIGPTGVDAPSNEYRARPGTYDYKTTFDLPAGATGVGLNLKTMGDNVVQTWINGHLLGKNNPTQDCPPTNACYWLQSHAVSMFDNNQAHFNIPGTNTIEIFVIDTRIGVGPAGSPAPPAFNGNSCELGPQQNGSLGFGNPANVPTSPDHQAGGASWSSTTCLNPTGLDFAGVAFYTPAPPPPPPVCDFITFGRLVVDVGGDKIVISGNAGGNAPGGGILGTIEIAVGRTQYHVPTIESYALATSGVLSPDPFARVITGHSGNHLIELRLRDNPNPGQGEPTDEGDKVWLKIDNTVIVPLQTPDQGNIQLHLHCRGPGE